MKSLIRRLLKQIASRDGYAISGNHVFAMADYAAISAGKYRPAVIEIPDRHSDRMVRVAELLARTY